MGPYLSRSSSGYTGTSRSKKTTELQLRWEVFKAFNHASFYLANAGQVQSNVFATRERQRLGTFPQRVK
jgi:hypothetical protein